MARIELVERGSVGRVRLEYGAWTPAPAVGRHYVELGRNIVYGAVAHQRGNRRVDPQGVEPLPDLGIQPVPGRPEVPVGGQNPGEVPQGSAIFGALQVIGKCLLKDAGSKQKLATR